MSQYANASNFANLGLPAAATTGVDPSVVTAHLVMASGRIDSYLPSHYKLPLSEPYPDVLVEATCVLAAHSLLTWLGHNPEAFDATFRERYLDLVGRPGQPGWLDKLAAGKVHLPGVVDATPTVNDGRARASSRASRGWYPTDGSGDDRI